MISVDQIDLQRGGKPLFEKATVTINGGERVAIIGENGCGKSSFFALLKGELEPESGAISLHEGVRISHMSQELDQISKKARDFVIDGHRPFREAEQKKQRAEKQNDDRMLAEAHGDLDALQAYKLEAEAEKIMAGLGFSPGDSEKLVSEFSGGWRIRLNLAKTLFMPSDLLLLDEPTNHLDMDAIIWLEKWLVVYQGTLLLISHDRDFIDSVASHIVHIENHRIYRYTGNYSRFEEQRAGQLQLQQAMYEKQQRRRKELQGFIDRFRAKATKARQAQSRIKALEKMQLVAAVREASPYQFRIPEADKSADPLMSWHEVSTGYNHAIIQNINFSISPGMRIALLGVNGAGKSTLIKTLAGELAPLEGDINSSEHLRTAYFAQHQLESLDLDASPLLHLQRLTPDAREQSMRDFLGGFQIHGDMACESIRHCSGGEKARLALAIIAWQKPNLLLLDEPTNHLDLEMRAALADALQAYSGAVVLVSHDRYLLRHCVDEFWRVHDGKVEVFDGSLDDYYRMLQDNEKANKETDINALTENNKKRQRQEAANERKRLAPLNQKIRQLEQAIEKLLSDQALIEEQLANNEMYLPENKQQLQDLLDQSAALKKQIADEEEAWLEQQTILESLASASET